MGSSSGSLVKSPSDSSKRLSGQRYSTSVYFHAHADSNAEHYEVEEKDLPKYLTPLIGQDEVITWVAVYKKPLGSWQMTDALLYHAFVIFQTQGWWWSIEKNDQGVTLQRSETKTFVLDRYRRSPRQSPVELIKSDEAWCPLKEFADLLYGTHAVGSAYNVMTSNCKHFAKTVFDRLARTEVW
eukprot:scpid92017/ scgid20545/ 